VSGRSPSRIVCGIGPISELLVARAEEVHELLVSRDRASRPGDAVARLAERARELGITVRAVGRRDLDEAAPGETHQGIAARAAPYAFAELGDVADAAAKEPPGLIVALDGVTDPHNFGAILRSSLLFGAHGVVVPKDRAARMTSTVTKASAGASESVRVTQVTNLARALGELKDDGFWVAQVAAGEGSQPLWTVDASLPLVLVLGSEGRGLRPGVAKRCDFALEIPMASAGVGSFNVSVSAAVALYEIARQRGQSGGAKAG